MVRVWVAGKTQCDPIVTRGPYLSALEKRAYNKALFKLICLLLLYFNNNHTNTHSNVSGAVITINHTNHNKKVGGVYS